jgi:hypothetical protein
MKLTCDSAHCCVKLVMGPDLVPSRTARCSLGGGLEVKKFDVAVGVTEEEKLHIDSFSVWGTKNFSILVPRKPHSALAHSVSLKRAAIYPVLCSRCEVPRIWIFHSSSLGKAR